MRCQRRAESSELVPGQEPIPSALPVAPQASARVAAVRAVSVDLRLTQGHGQNRKRAIRRRQRRMQGSEPALHLTVRDVADRAPAEPGQDLIAQVRPVDLAGPLLPGAAVATEYLLGDRLEGGRGGFRS